MVRPFLLCFDFLFFIMRLSGLILRDVLIKSLMVMGRHPSTLAFLVSMRTKLGIPLI